MMQLVERKFVYRVQRNGTLYERRPDGTWLYQLESKQWEFVLNAVWRHDLETDFHTMKAEGYDGTLPAR